MPLRKADKLQLTDEYQKLVSASPALLVFDYRGLSVKKFSDLRNKVRDAGGTIRVVKNRMLKRAIEDRSFSDQMSTHLVGPSAIIFMENDPVKPTKALVDFAKDNEQVLIKCGMVSDTFIDASGVEILSKTPSLEELHSKILGGIKAPATNLLGLFKGAHQKLHGLITAYADKLDEAA